MDKVVPKLVRGYKIGSFKKLLCHREAILYALSVGCTHKSVEDPTFSACNKYTYENDKNFEVIQSLTAQFSVLDLEKIRACPGLPAYDPMALLHGEQVIKFHKPLKVGQDLENVNTIVDVADKKSGGLVTIESKSFDKANNNELITENYAKLFIRGIGGFGDSGQLEATKFPKPSKETPIDKITIPTVEDQAHYYRMASGDLNPLHVDPVLAANGGFKKPILHGLCTLGISTAGYQRVFNTSSFSSIGVRFTAPTTPGSNLLIKFFETENSNQIWFDTIAYTDSVENGTVIAKGFFTTA